MSSALTYIAIANFFGSQPWPNVTTIPPGSIPASLQGAFLQFQASRYNYTYTPDIGAHRVSTGISTWNTARRTCNDQGGHLAIVNSVAEAEAIGRALQASDATYGWIGVHDFYQEDEFVTIHGESLGQTGFNVWRKGEPNNVAGNEHCVVLNSEGKMIDVVCSARFNSICEFPYVHDQLDLLPTSTEPGPTEATKIVDPGLA